MKTIFIFLMFLSINCCYCQPALNKLYIDETGNSGITVIPETNGYLVAGDGYSAQFADGAALWSAIKLYRVDSLGTIIWTKQFGKSAKAYQLGGFGGGVKKTSDNGYIIPGGFDDSATNITTALLIKTDSIADTLWTHTLTLGSFTLFNDCVETPDSGFVIAGVTTGLGDPNGDVLVAKFDKNGIILWKKKYGGDKEDVAYNINLMPDGGFVISGTTLSFGPGTENNYVIRTDSLGDTIWTRTYGIANGANGACSVAPSVNSGFIMFGQWDTIHNNGEGGVSYVAKLDISGNIKWLNFFSDTSYLIIWQLRELANGEIIVTTQRQTYSIYDGGAITKLDSSGNKLWETLLLYTGPGPSPDGIPYTSGYFYDLQPTRDKGIALTGIFNYYNDSTGHMSEIWLVKTDSMGCVDSYCGIEGINEVNKLVTNTELKIYPNPAQNIATVEWQSTNQYEATVTVYDLLGREILSKKVSPGIDKIQMDISGFVNGLYLVKLFPAKGNSMSGKLSVIN